MLLLRVIGSWKYTGAHCKITADSIEELLMNTDPDCLTQETPFSRLVHGHYGLASTYWALFLLGAALFFVFGSLAVAEHNWPHFMVLLALSLAWTCLLLTGVQRGFKGTDPGKAMARIAMLFLTLNLTNTLAVLSFI